MGERNIKPLGIKLYGHIPHLHGSRMGPGDHKCHEGQDRICTVKTRDRHDEIFVSVKLDGSNVGVCNLDGVIIPLTRAGYRAADSPYRQHHLFNDWAYTQYERFERLLAPGERVVGEWLAQAHGTRYDLFHEPFVVFDLFDVKGNRIRYDKLKERCSEFVLPTLLHRGGAISEEAILKMLQTPRHGELDPVEGAVWRVERKGEVDFLAKYVLPDKEDGKYLDLEGRQPLWNWLPEGVTG